MPTIRATAAACLLLLVGCAGPAPADSPTVLLTPASPAVTASPSGSPTLSTATAPPTPTVRTISITLADGKVKPNGERVELAKGEPFVLDIRSDRDDEVHVHGIDRTIAVTKGDRQRVELTIRASGRYEVESHHPASVIVVLQVR